MYVSACRTENLSLNAIMFIISKSAVYMTLSDFSPSCVKKVMLYFWLAALCAILEEKTSISPYVKLLIVLVVGYATALVVVVLLGYITTILIVLLLGYVMTILIVLSVGYVRTNEECLVALIMADFNVELFLNCSDRVVYTVAV